MAFENTIYVKRESQLQLGDATDNWELVKVSYDGENDSFDDVLAVTQTEGLLEILVTGLGVTLSDV